MSRQRSDLTHSSPGLTSKKSFCHFSCPKLAYPLTLLGWFKGRILVGHSTLLFYFVDMFSFASYSYLPVSLAHQALSWIR